MKGSVESSFRESADELNMYFSEVGSHFLTVRGGVRDANIRVGESNFHPL
jgi:hypothetical protein